MKSRHYRYLDGRFYQPDSVNGSIGSAMSWNLYSYVQGNPMNFVDPYGLRFRSETAGAIVGTLPSTANTDEEKELECRMQGGTWKFGTCVYDFGFGENVEVIGEPFGDEGSGLSEEEIKKYLPDEFFEEFNLTPFEVWASQPSGHESAWAFKPNYNDPAVQIMAQVSSNVQPWLEYGESYLDLSLSLIPIDFIGNFKYKLIKYGIEARSKQVGDLCFRLNFMHSAHHNFKLIGKFRHFQLNIWEEGIKNSAKTFRFPYFFK
jgi:hypothetical protein